MRHMRRNEVVEHAGYLEKLRRNRCRKGTTESLQDVGPGL